MKVRWTPAAKRDRAAIFEYIEERNADAAARMDARFDEVVGKLADFPMMGHAGEIPTRESSARIKAIDWSIESSAMPYGY